MSRFPLVLSHTTLPSIPLDPHLHALSLIITCTSSPHDHHSRCIKASVTLHSWSDLVKSGPWFLSNLQETILVFSVFLSIF
jgi:hypothetical protein